MHLQSASHNAPINTAQIQSPKIGLKGLQQLVEIVAKIKASDQSQEKEELECPSETSPPVRLSAEREPMAKVAASAAAATDQCLEPNAGEPSESPREGGQS
jgi:hypothetical protein